MSVFGQIVEGKITVATDDDLSGPIDLDNNGAFGGFDTVQIMIPVMTPCNLSLQGSLDGTIYYDIANAASIAVGATPRADTLVCGGYRYLKIKTSVAQAADRTFQLRGKKI